MEKCIIIFSVSYYRVTSMNQLPQLSFLFPFYWLRNLKSVDEAFFVIAITLSDISFLQLLLSFFYCAVQLISEH